jgi:WD40 repeat protein
VGSDNSTAAVWDFALDRRVFVLRGHEGGLWSAAFSPDGGHIVTAANDGVREWDAETGHEIAILLRGRDQVRSARYNSDGSQIVTASADRIVRLWDEANARLIASFRGHQGEVWTAAFSPDNTRILSASSDGTARLWPIAPTFREGRADLVREACNVTLANGLRQFSPAEFKLALALDPILDFDACDAPTVWMRVAKALGFR